MEFVPPDESRLALDCRVTVQRGVFEVRRARVACTRVLPRLDIDITRLTWELDDDDASRVLEVAGIGPLDDGETVRVGKWHWLDELPYEVHTCRELPLMLAGHKPFAAFSDTREFLQPYIQAFAPHVASGRFVEQITEEERSISLLYAVPGQTWRFDAWHAVQEAQWATGWCDALEWQEGRLLGYTREQQRVWMQACDWLQRVGRRLW